MFNVNQITSQLAKMPDQALQQYAAMHKNDPYTVSLALAESNRRKDMRMGATPMPGQMPKVVDQDIAQMVAPPQPQMMPQQARPPMPPQAQQQLPENVGIGQLPAQNIQGMADGGIVGYSGKDDDQLVRNPLAFLNPGDMWDAAQRWRASGQALLPYLGVQTTRPVQPKLTAQQERDLNIAQAQALGTSPAAGYTRPAMVNDPRLPEGYQTTATAVTPPQGAPTGAAPAGGLPTVPPKTGAGPAAPAGGISALPSEADAIKRFKDALGTSTEPTVKKEDFLKELGDISKPAYDKANSLIETEKGRLKEGKEQDFYMSLIQGGLAAAGEAGPNALQNIAKGFEKGAANYSAALKDFRKASQENAKMELELSRAEAADKKGDLKSYYDHQEKAMDRQAKKDDRIAAGISSIITTAEHGKYSLAAADISGRAHVAAAGAGARANQNLMEALGNAEPTSALRKGFDLQTMKAHAASLQENWSRQAYPTGNMGEPNQAFLARYPTPQTYIQENLQSMGSIGGGGFVQPPANATILPPKK